jgi:hypothetical protein
MNKTETKAYNWLLNKGYKPKDIVFQKRNTPDYLTSDRKGYEVKLKYGSSIWFYRNQIDALKSMDDAEILVFDKESETPFLIIPSKELLENKIINGIKIVVASTENKIKFTLPDIHYTWILEEKKKRGLETIQDTIRSIIMDSYRLEHAPKTINTL